MSRYQRKASRNLQGTGKQGFAQEERKARPATAANFVGGILNAGIATVGAFLGYKAAGPVGAGGGVLASSAIVETAKHYATAGFSAMMNRKGNNSGGSGGGGDATVEGLRAAVTGVAEELTSSTSGAVLSAIQIIEESLNNFGTITDGYSSYIVEEVKTQLGNAFTACDEARTLYTNAAESARAWAAGV